MGNGSKATKILMSGNEAIAVGAVEAGISLAVGYPGTPSTDIIEYLAKNFKGNAQWVLNEKIALETAIGASYAGKRALCTMKHVGLNVASDPLMSITYLGIKGGLTLLVADDPGAYSSQNEQDSRYFARFANMPCFEPSDAQEAKDMTKAAFDLSEEFKLPVMVRSVTRISHSATPVELSDSRPENPLSLEKDPAHMLAVPSNVIRCHKELNDKYARLAGWSVSSVYNKVTRTGFKKGIISSGIAYAYANEAGAEYNMLKIDFYPFPEKIIEDFVKNLDEVWIMEEGEPLIEDIARRYHKNVRGKLSGDFEREGELGPDAMIHQSIDTSETRACMVGQEELPKRPPVMCPGCPHRELYKALKDAVPVFTTGDIGCYTLGATPPLAAMDTCLCMGASISKAAGISYQGVKRVAAVIGDSTFLHSGIPALISAVYNKANILVLILDNSCVAMTGHQPTPLVGQTAKREQGGSICLKDLCAACGPASVDVVNPYKFEEASKKIKERLDQEGVHVIISESPCVLIAGKLKKA
ncbi:MAG: thiamine pyrophosphate-dependent enzyme [Dissulfurispiraceae bacterium]|jgi:indolepyruvate ferredoxin oxidoreductase alpha subunit|nr:thiamine pyrophosphate-dependent enzyme [Dissulfurispiraceae bacterium]